MSDTDLGPNPMRHVEGKYWRYIDDPDDAPDWADVEEAPNGGQYRYETEGGPDGSSGGSNGSGDSGSGGSEAGSGGSTATPNGSKTASDVEQGDKLVIDGLEAEVSTVKDMGGGFYIAGRTEDDEIVTARVGPDSEFDGWSGGGDDGGDEDSGGYDVSGDGFDRELADAVESGEMLGTDAIYRNMGKVDDPELVADALELELEGKDRKTARERLESKLRTLEGEGAVREVRARLDGSDAEFSVGDTVTRSHHPNGQEEAVEEDHVIAEVDEDPDDYDGVIYKSEDGTVLFDWQVYDGASISAGEGDTVSIATGDGRRDITIARVDPKKCGPGMTELEDKNGKAYCVKADDVGKPVDDDRDFSDVGEGDVINVSGGGGMEPEWDDQVVVQEVRESEWGSKVVVASNDQIFREDDFDGFAGEDGIYEFSDIEEGDTVTVMRSNGSVHEITVDRIREGEPDDIVYSDTGGAYVESDIVYDDPTSDATGEDKSVMSNLEEGDVVETAGGDSIELDLVAEQDGDTIVYDQDSNAYRIDDLSPELTDRSDSAGDAFERVCGWGFTYNPDESVEENFDRLEGVKGGTEKRQKVMRRLPEDEVPEDYEPPAAVETMGEFRKIDRGTEDKIKRVLENELEGRVKIGGVFRETVRGLDIHDKVSRANSRSGLIKVKRDEKRSTIQHEMAHQIFQAHGISTGFGGTGNDKAHNFKHRPPEWPKDHNERQDMFNTNDRAPEELNELAEAVNDSFKSMVDDIRETSEDTPGGYGKVPVGMAHQLDKVFYNYAACNSHETLAMTHEIMQTGGERAGFSALKTLEREHPDLLEAYSKVFDVPQETRSKMTDTSMLAPNAGEADGGREGWESTGGKPPWTTVDRETFREIAKRYEDNVTVDDVASDNYDEEMFREMVDQYMSSKLLADINRDILDMQS